MSRACRPDRGGAWDPCLGALATIRTHDLERARLLLGHRQGRAAEVQAEAAHWGACRTAVLHEVGPVTGATLDPARAAQGLAYLVHVEGQLARVGHRRDAAAADVRAAARDCIAADRRLQAVVELRRRAEAARAQDERRRAERQADVEWLARVHGRRHGGVGEED